MSPAAALEAPSSCWKPALPLRRSVGPSCSLRLQSSLASVRTIGPDSPGVSQRRAREPSKGSSMSSQPSSRGSRRTSDMFSWAIRLEASSSVPTRRVTPIGRRPRPRRSGSRLAHDDAAAHAASAGWPTVVPDWRIARARWRRARVPDPPDGRRPWRTKTVCPNLRSHRRANAGAARGEVWKLPVDVHPVVQALWCQPKCFQAMAETFWRSNETALRSPVSCRRVRFR